MGVSQRSSGSTSGIVENYFRNTLGLYQESFEVIPGFLEVSKESFESIVYLLVSGSLEQINKIEQKHSSLWNIND